MKSKIAQNMKPEAKSFHFTGWKFEKSKATFNYRIEFTNREPLEFSETLIFHKHEKNPAEITKRIFDGLHLILGISYYKLYIPPRIQLSQKLNKEQAVFWTTVYRKGLGEFCYRNKINPQKLAKFPSSKSSITPIAFPRKNRSLLGIGGGKDSIVAGELLKENNEDFTAFLLETQKPEPIAEAVIKEMKVPSLKIERHLDPQIFQKHEGSYNGHIPISTIFAFVALAASALYNYKNTIVGNEYSSNFGNITYKGMEVNHQWSKSAEFEAMFQNYIHKFITKDINYFSLLRQFYEIRIAEMFARHKNYFPIFSSCNRNFKIGEKRLNETFKASRGAEQNKSLKRLWCGECAKCVFVFTILSPFIAHKELVKIFGKDIFTDPNLKQMLKDITGRGKMKPFDCVGTFEEASAALAAAFSHTKGVSIRTNDSESAKVFRTVPAPTLPTEFKFAGIKNIAIIGYGREGKITEKYIHKNFPKLPITILDQSLNKNYLARQSDFDFAIKTPGIPKSKVTIPYTTATNIFFAHNKNFTIGVTGSKGKSTSATLIYEILKAAGKKVRLLGNIGNPMLETLLTKPDPDEIFVIELSSYMLDDIEYSPNIALLLNLFPEHMNYHGNTKNYYTAKQNIFAFQKPGDIALRPPFTQKIPTKKIPLLGEHNRANIKAAIAVARTLKIHDSAIISAIENFKPLPHRLEFVTEKNGIKFYDDAISTTPESTIEAIKTLKNVGTIFLGGEDRGYDFHELVKTLRKFKIRNLVLFPDSGKKILQAIKKNGTFTKNFNIFETRSMKDAVAFAFTHTSPGKICLLSTASPSYSLWKNFEEKGEEFASFVRDHLIKI